MKRSFIESGFSTHPVAVRPPGARPVAAGRFQLLALTLVAVVAVLTGCNNQPPAAHNFPPANGTVSKPVQKEVVDWNEFTGQPATVNLVNATARGSGCTVNIPFKEADMVHKSDLLYQ